MSFTAMAWASKQKVNSSTQKLVLLMLANYADDEDKCWPSKQTLADTCCMSKAAICANISKLQEAGFLKVEKREGTSSIIRLNTGVQHVDRGCPPRGQGVSTRKTEGVHHVDTNLSMNQSDETITEEYISAQAEFDEFWAAYPKRPGNPKAPAIAKYVNARQKLKVPHETLLQAVKAYAATRVGEDPKFTAQAVTWLNQRRWEDYDGSAPEPQPKATISDEAYRAVTEHYPGKASDPDEAKRLMAAEVNKGAKPEDIADAAHKFKLLVKQARNDGHDMAVPILETWLKFKWRDMDAYEFYRGGMTMKLFVRPKRGK